MLTTNGLWLWVIPVKWLRIQSLLLNGAQIAQAPCCNEFTRNFLISKVGQDPNGKESIRMDITAIFETFQESRNNKMHRVRMKISQSLWREKPTGKGKLTGGFHHMIQSKCCLPDLRPKSLGSTSGRVVKLWVRVCGSLVEHFPVSTKAQKPSPACTKKESRAPGGMLGSRIQQALNAKIRPAGKSRALVECWGWNNWARIPGCWNLLKSLYHCFPIKGYDDTW